MKYVYCLNPDCKNKICTDFPRKLYTIHPNNTIKHIDTIITNYQFENEYSRAIWAPIRYENNALFSPFCSRNCLEHHQKNYNSAKIYVITQHH